MYQLAKESATKNEFLTNICPLDECLKEHVRNVWKEKVASGFERLSSETAWKLHTLYRVGGGSWYVATLVEELLKTVYHTDLDKYADLVVSFFNVDIEQCTLVLLLDVLPSYIQVSIGAQEHFW